MYTYFSLAKIIIWLIICLSIYFTIDPYADPLVAVWWGMIWLFILVWWASFYVFYGRKKFIYHTKENTTMIIESYKLSLLFGIYTLINAIFLLRHQWTIVGWIILLIWFVIIQAILIPEQPHHNSKSKKHSIDSIPDNF